MLTELQYLLTVLAEECVESAQRASKAIRFGLDEKEPGQDLTNRERLGKELSEVLCLMGMLDAAGGLCDLPNEVLIMAKAERVKKYMEYSRQCGTLEPEPTPASE